MRALIVEDDPSLRNVLTRLVQRTFEGVVVQTTNNVDGAIALLKESVFTGDFDLVLCDYNLVGHRTGLDILTWIRDHLAHLEDRFVFLSSDDAIQKCGVPFFDKPCDVPSLKQTMRKLVYRCPEECIQGHLYPKATEDSDGAPSGPCPICNSK